MPYTLTRKSRNGKTGSIPVSTSGRETCSPTCPLYEAGCFGNSGKLKLVWDDVTYGNGRVQPKSLLEFCDEVSSLPLGQLWRHNQAGDLPGDGDKIDHESIAALVAANYGKRGFTYTHKPVLEGPEALENREAVECCNAYGFTVNLSGNNLAHADQLADLGIAPVVSLLPEGVERETKTPAGRRVRRCPAEYLEEVTCKSCGICHRQSRSYIVGFTPHGSQAKAAREVANG